MNKTNGFLILASTFVISLLSCNIAQDKKEESITSGSLRIAVDESYSLLMDTEVFTYTHLNKYASISSQTAPESDVFKALLADSVQAAVVGRALTEEELAFFKSKQRVPESILIARDGIALVVHPEHADSVIHLDKVKGIFSGSDSLWSQVQPGGSNAKINVVFDNPGSCNARSLSEKFGVEQFPSWCFSEETTERVIAYVNAHPNSIGVISLSWISDAEDSTCAAYRKLVKPLGIVDPSNVIKPELPRRPFQAYVFDGTYPLRRDVYYIRTGLRGTLGTGFANHLIGEKGQLIIHKMGMVAAKTPNRTVKIVDQ
ncbi:MAG: PstS family phosphate ABC transporter substrate-binding protein [Flavobacteriales bacterium]|jgi:phosphate transport system substrate-binding protein